MLTLVFLGVLLDTAASGSTEEQSRLRERALEALRGRRIRVTYTHHENPYLIKDEQGEWSGILGDFLKEVSKEAELLLDVRDVSNESISAVGFNRNTGCPRDISKNRTDLCIGNSWVTTQRLGYAVATPSMWQDTLFVCVKQNGGTSIRGALLEAFKPFDGWLWCAIFAVLLLYAVSARYAEYQYNDRDFPEKGFLQSGILSLYHVTYSFWWSEPPTRPVTMEGRILAVGFGFFTLVILSSYTASLTDLLVGRRDTPAFKDLNDAISRNVPICMFTSMLARAEKLYPRLPPLVMEITTWEDGFEWLDSGRCSVLLVDEMIYAKAQEKAERDCDKVLVGEAVININAAWYVADWLASPFSYVFADMVDRGILDDLRRVYTPRVLCPRDTVVQGLSAGRMSGVFFIVGVFLAAAALVHSFKRSAHYGKHSETLKRISPKIHRWSFGSTDSGQALTQTTCKPSGSGSIRRSLQSLQSNDPGEDLVEAFRSEKRMTEMPYEKALLLMGQAQLDSNAVLLTMLREMVAAARPKERSPEQAAQLPHRSSYSSTKQSLAQLGPRLAARLSPRRREERFSGSRSTEQATEPMFNSLPPVPPSPRESEWAC